MYSEFKDFTIQLGKLIQRKISKNLVGKYQFGLWFYKILYLYVYFDIAGTFRMNKI